MTYASCCTFTHALVRKPGRSVANGLRDGNSDDPIPDIFAAEHAAYVAALGATGAEIIELPPLEDYPDSVFVEDPVLCIAGVAIILRPGAPSRFGERDFARKALKNVFSHILELPDHGFVDGGDILVTDREALIGLSARTNREGVAGLEPILTDLGMPLRIVVTPPEILHFKTECGILDTGTIFATTQLARSGCFEGYRVIECPEGEEAAANLIRFNDQVFVAAGFPRTLDLLRAEGFQVTALDVAQAARIDGGLSCMSLRFTLAGE